MTGASHSSTMTRSAKVEFFTLAPLVLVVFLGFLAVGIPMASLPLDICDTLGFGTATVGGVIAIQSIATILTRHRAGAYSDHRGPRRAVMLGLPLAAAAGVLYLASALVPSTPDVKLALLGFGRIVMGLGESLFITGAMSWGIGRLGASRTGTVMSWQGIAMYAALGLGAPIGLAVQHFHGFEAVAVLTIAMPLLGAAVASGLAPVPAMGGHRAAFHQVLALIWRPGLVLSLATVPFAIISTFLALAFAAKDWPGAGAALAGFAAGYVLVRLLGSRLPDRLGGLRVAGGSLLVESLGLALLWMAPGPSIAIVGATLTGIGFSLIFPAMGVVATRSVAADQRGRAIGNFIAFFDLALGLSGPGVGLAVGRYGYPAAFLMGGGAALAALALLASFTPANRSASSPRNRSRS